MEARHLYSHADGYQCELAATGEGWAMIAAGLPAVDERFVANMDAADREWEPYEAFAGPVCLWPSESTPTPRRTKGVWLIGSDGYASALCTRRKRRRCPGLPWRAATGPPGRGPCRSGGAWRVELFEEGRVVVEATSPDPLLNPSLARDDRAGTRCTWRRERCATAGGCM